MAATGTRLAEPRPTFPGVVALAVVFAILLGSRALAAVVPGSWLWGIDQLRFLPPAAWLLYAFSAIVWIPWLAQRLLPAWERIGNALTERPALSSTIAAVLGAGFVLAFPDRVHFTGDFLVREHALAVSDAGFAALFPQAMPLEAVIHDRLARAAMDWTGLDANGSGRLFGAIEAALLAILAVRVVHVLTLKGAAAFTVVVVVFMTPLIGLMTGYHKAFSELAVVTLGVAVLALEVVRSGRGFVALGAVLAVGLLLHRLAFLLVPTMIVAGWSGWRRYRSPTLGVIAAGVLLPIAAVVAVAPDFLRLVRFDAVTNFANPEVRTLGGPLAAAFAGPRPMDLANLVLRVAPLALLIPWLLVWRTRSPTNPELVVLTALAAPLLMLLPFFHPGYGLFRAWEAAATTGVALAVVTGYLAAGATQRHGAWLAIPITSFAVLATTHALWLDALPDRGLRRIETWVVGPPLRDPTERASAWDFLGIRYADQGELAASARAFENAARLAPSPKTLRAWAAVERARGRWVVARDLYHRLLERKPDESVAWFELATLDLEVGDLVEARQAAESLLALDPESPNGRRILAELERRSGAREVSHPVGR
jgi:cytochrome c-type biogenesis protein CcmH/NrfG